MIAAIFRASSVRARWARMYSTAGMKRHVRKVLGQASGACSVSWSMPRLRVRSSNAAAASVARMKLIA